MKSAVFTTVAPFNTEAQVSALRTWRKAGHEITSFNHPAEIPGLGALPEWIRVEPTYFAAGFGKYLIPLTVLLREMRRRCPEDGTVIYVNSDIGLGNPNVLQQLHRSDHDLVFASRIEVDARTRELGSPYLKGFDFFALGKRFLESVPRNRLRIGLPWWDYWLPCHALTTGARVRRVPILDFVTHVSHTQNWSNPLFYELGREFIRTINIAKLGLPRLARYQWDSDLRWHTVPNSMILSLAQSIWQSLIQH